MTEVIIAATSFVILFGTGTLFMKNLDRLKYLRTIPPENSFMSSIPTMRSQARKGLLKYFGLSMVVCSACLYLLWVSSEDTFFLASIQFAPIIGLIFVPSLQYFTRWIISRKRQT